MPVSLVHAARKWRRRVNERTSSAKQKTRTTTLKKKKKKKMMKNESETGIREVCPCTRLPAKPLSNELYIASPSPARYRFNFKLKFMNGLLSFCWIELRTFSAFYCTDSRPIYAYIAPRMFISRRRKRSFSCLQTSGGAFKYAHFLLLIRFDSNIRLIGNSCRWCAREDEGDCYRTIRKRIVSHSCFNRINFFWILISSEIRLSFLTRVEERNWSKVKRTIEVRNDHSFSLSG